MCIFPLLPDNLQGLCYAVFSGPKQPGQAFRKIVAASESRSVENYAPNQDHNAGHFIDKIIFSIRKNLLVLEILFHHDAARHDSGEFSIVQDIGARVGSHVLFQDLFRNPANASAQARQSCGIHDCFHELVVRHVYILKLFFQSVIATSHT